MPIPRLSESFLHWLSIFDVIAVPIFTLYVIWFMPPNTSSVWLALPIWLAITFLLHRDTPYTLGWRAKNLGPATLHATFLFGAMAIPLIAAGLILGPRYGHYSMGFTARHLWNYFAFCLLQQVGMNSLLTNRFLSLIRRPWVAILLSAVIFSTLHLPNPVLVVATLIAGTATAWLFSRDRSILPLALWQAILGTLVASSIPRIWLHNMRVGPGFYRFH